VGEPPKSFNAGQRAAWRELAPQVAGVYTSSDRAAFCLLCKLSALVEPADAIDRLSASGYARVVSLVAGMLQGFGCTPASRSRVEASRAPALDASELFLFHGGPAPSTLRAS
jgi:hypothetical protein